MGSCNEHESSNLKLTITLTFNARRRYGQICGEIFMHALAAICSAVAAFDRNF